MGVVKRGEVYWVNLDPTGGSENPENPPLLIVSPDGMNAACRAPSSRRSPAAASRLCRPEVEFKGKSARMLLNQLRSVDKQRLGGKMGKIDLALWHPVLLEMFA